MDVYEAVVDLDGFVIEVIEENYMELVSSELQYQDIVVPWGP